MKLLKHRIEGDTLFVKQQRRFSKNFCLNVADYVTALASGVKFVDFGGIVRVPIDAVDRSTVVNGESGTYYEVNVRKPGAVQEGGEIILIQDPKSPTASLLGVLHNEQNMHNMTIKRLMPLLYKKGKKVLLDPNLGQHGGFRIVG